MSSRVESIQHGASGPGQRTRPVGARDPSALQVPGQERLGSHPGQHRQSEHLGNVIGADTAR